MNDRERFQRIGELFRTAAPLAPVNQLQKTFVPNVTKRVAAETDHKVRFIEGYGGTIANLFEVLESTQKGLVDFGAMCSCFEPTKLFSKSCDVKRRDLPSRKSSTVSAKMMMTSGNAQPIETTSRRMTGARRELRPESGRGLGTYG